MKCSILLVALSGLLAAASPLHARDSTHRSGKRGVSSCKARSAMPQPQPAPAPAPAPAPEPALKPVVLAAAATDSYSKTVLDRHNLHRQNHTVGALAWDNTLTQYAQNIAAKCVFAHDLKQGKGGYGQNIAAFGSTDKNLPNLKEKTALNSVTEAWYNSEMKNWPASTYGQANPPSGMDLDKYGHFTQLVWKSSTKLGCASQLCPAGKIFGYPTWFTVCNYQSPGNVGGQYGQNVLPPKGLATVHANV